jgi:spore maturation protein CgeB
MGVMGEGMVDKRRKILYLGNRRLYYGFGKGFKNDMFLELFRAELSRQHDTLCWGWGYRYGWDGERQFSDVVKFFGEPDMVLTDAYYDYTGFGIGDIKAVKAHIVGDFYRGVSDRVFNKSIHIFKQYDFLLAVCNSALELLRENFPREKCHFWPWSVDTNFFRNYDRDRYIDVFFGAATIESLYGPYRKDVQRLVMDMYKEGFNTRYDKRYFFGDYVDVLNSSKIAISNNEKYGFMTKKVLEFMACGTLLLTDKCEEFDMLGFDDGKHLVVYNGLDDLKDKIYYYLSNDSKREMIASEGYNFVFKNFSTRGSVGKMMDIVRLKG